MGGNFSNSAVIGLLRNTREPLTINLMLWLQMNWRTMELNPFLLMKLERSCALPLMGIWQPVNAPNHSRETRRSRNILDEIFIWTSVGHITLFKCFISSQTNRKMLWRVPFELDLHVKWGATASSKLWKSKIFCF